ncbi:hypothetical protein KTR66_19595 [Roseococcus sp. SDR]|uniref:hypothetical protein n=1 Tax=Roseococcus sp. SDR TaxID=2835532 RepID=UPI001BD0F7C2|nr:hypothetical protein [Roseococcus sp. SDR]MBS7792212.1 hypothetical protein [Roseococcus sp. SDR]MBV1847526.1 hypothetical protein [Roseococcus sp. SDR]
MRRPLFLSLPAALLAACAGQTTGIEPTGGDAFVLARANVSGVAAVHDGLAQAQSFCGEHGRLFVMTNSQVGSSDYRLDFRCIAPNNLPPPPVVAAAPPPAPTRATRGRRAAPAPETTSTGPALGFAANLPPMEREAPAPASWQPADANILPAVTPMTTRPLFAPPPGQSLVAAASPPRRLPPPDNSELVLLPRLENTAVAPQAAPAAAAPAIEAPQAAQPAPPLPVITRQELPGSLPPIQAASPSPAPPLPVITANQPLPGYGLVVPSPNPLPGAPSSLPPIAGPARTPSFPSAPASGFPTGTTSFTQGFR